EQATEDEDGEPEASPQQQSQVQGELEHQANSEEARATQDAKDKEEEARKQAEARNEEQARQLAAKARKEEQAKLAAKAREEEQAKLAAKARKEEEAKLAAKAREEEQAKLAAAKAREEEQAKLAAKAREEEQAKLAAKARKEEEAKLAAKAREEEQTKEKLAQEAGAVADGKARFARDPDQFRMAALDRRLRRIVAPDSQGRYKVSQSIRDQWANIGLERDNVYRLFAECKNDPETFTKRFAITREKELEAEMKVSFEFLSKQEMSEDPYCMEDIDEIVAKAQKEPKRFIRQIRDRIGIKEECETDCVDATLDIDMDELAKMLKRLGLAGKVKHLYEQLDAITDELEEFKTGGVLDGFSDEVEKRIDLKLLDARQKLHAGRYDANKSAPACSIGEVARALVTDEAATSSLADASKVDHSHSERNAHRLFNRYGLALKVPISELKVANDANEDFVTVPYLRMRDYIQVLLKQHPEVLLGGLPVAESQGLLRTFWQRYRVYHDKHIVFQHYDESVWGSLIPVFVHGDKGRTLGKSPIFVLSWEIPFGLPPELLSKASADSRGTASKQKGDGRLHWSCEERTRFSGKRTHAQMNGTCTVSDPDAFNNTKPETCHQRCNNKGHSYLSRFLIAAITSKTYKQNSKILPSILQETATELDELFYTGLEVSGVTFRFAFLGAKGDAEWHFEAGAFNRSYHKTGVKRDLPICPHCEAGKPGLSISDAASEPPWAATLGTTDPWEELPPLNHAPYAATFKAGLYKFDPFHVLKFGVFRDAVGSVLVRLCMMGYFDFCSDDSDAIEARFERAFAKFKLWCMASKKFPAIRQFSKANMHFE
ncbi:unnamed protein product, partial [Symbiodinium sp. KB8]